MVRVCDSLREQHDFVLVDSPAGIEQGFRFAIAPADEILIVTNPEVAAVRDADRIIGLLEAEEQGPARLVINRIKPDMVRRGEMLDIADVVELLSVDLIGIVPEDQAILVAANRGQPLAFSSDSSSAGRAFHNIARRLLGEDVPFITLREPGVLEKLFRFVRSEGD
jgi:septum site-determining protein MinD